MRDHMHLPTGRRAHPCSGRTHHDEQQRAGASEAPDLALVAERDDQGCAAMALADGRGLAGSSSRGRMIRSVPPREASPFAPSPPTIFFHRCSSLGFSSHDERCGGARVGSPLHVVL
jgi:hypothetical protein